MWYVFGNYVLDKIFNFNRCKRLSIYYSEAPPDRNEISNSLKLEKNDIPIDFYDTPPKIVTEIDNYVIQSSGNLFHLNLNQTINPTPPIHISPLLYDLRAEDAIRLWHLHKSYPELTFDKPLLKKIASDIEYYLSIRKNFEELDLLLLNYSAA